MDSAVGTKLDHESPAYKALAEKHSYTGPATVFGKNYQGNYAPLMSADGKLTGALFVGVGQKAVHIVAIMKCDHEHHGPHASERLTLNK